MNGGGGAGISLVGCGDISHESPALAGGEVVGHTAPCCMKGPACVNQGSIVGAGGGRCIVVEAAGGLPACAPNNHVPFRRGLSEYVALGTNGLSVSFAGCSSCPGRTTPLNAC